MKAINKTINGSIIEHSHKAIRGYEHSHKSLYKAYASTYIQLYCIIKEGFKKPINTFVILEATDDFDNFKEVM